MTDREITEPFIDHLMELTGGCGYSYDAGSYFITKYYYAHMCDPSAPRWSLAIAKIQYQDGIMIICPDLYRVPSTEHNLADPDVAVDMARRLQHIIKNTVSVNKGKSPPSFYYLSDMLTGLLFIVCTLAMLSALTFSILIYDYFVNKQAGPNHHLVSTLVALSIVMSMVAGRKISKYTSN
jgi:hypothetical protein